MTDESALLNSIVQDAPVALALLDLNGLVRIWNRAAERLFGWSEAEVVGNPLPTIPPGAQTEAVDLQARMASGQTLENVSLVRMTRSGERREVRLLGLPLRDPRGEVIGLAAIYQDPSHGAFPDSETDLVMDVPFRGLVEQTLAGLYVIQDGILQYSNAQYAAMYGYRPEEMIGHRVEDFIAESDRPLYLENMRRRLSGEQPSIRYYLRGKHRDGHEVDMEAHGACFQYRGRSAIIGIQLDISDRLHVERELKESEARLKAMAENVPGVVYQQTLGPSCKLQFPYVSEGIRALCGVVPAAVVANPNELIDLIPLPDRDRYLASLRISAATLGEWNWEGRLTSRTGQVIWVNGRARPRKIPCGDTLWDGLLTNITHRKQQAEELHESRERLRELTTHLNSLREEQRTKIAREIHDVLGGTLTTLMMDLEWLVERLHDAKARERAQAMVGITQNALATIRKISSDLRPGVLDNLGLLAAIEWQVEELRSRIGITCHLSLPEERPRLPEHDATAIFRIFQEALTNIVRHASATQIEVIVDVTHNILQLIVEDDGSGITAKQLMEPRSLGILGMFERAREIGANLNIEGQPGQGTRLILAYPIPNAR